MNPDRESTQSFIVRIWLESHENKDARPLWRGVIQHVSTGKAVYFLNLDQVMTYLTGIIEDMVGISPEG